MDTSIPDWQRRPLIRAGVYVVKKLEYLIAKADPKGNQPFFNSDDYPWVERLESHWPVIFSELQQILQYQDQLPSFQEISQDQISITQDQLWKAFFSTVMATKQKKTAAAVHRLLNCWRGYPLC